MSIDTSEEDRITAPQLPPATDAQIGLDQWKSLSSKITKRAGHETAREIFGKAARGGSVYRWGFSAALGRSCDSQLRALSRMACDVRLGRKEVDGVEFPSVVDALIDRINGTSPLRPAESAEIVLWAASLPALTRVLDQGRWWHLLSSIQQFREAILQRGEPFSPAHLILGGELGLTLAWRLRDLPSCKRLQSSSIDALKEWCRRDDESVSSAIAGSTNGRLVLASLLRSLTLIEKISSSRIGKQPFRVGASLATWVTAMTTHTGETAFSSASEKDVRDDIGPHGLLVSATRLDPDSLRPALSAALGKKQSGGRLVWEIDLPESLHHDVESKVAVMFPDWDVRRGRTHVDYSGEEMRLEVFAGRSCAIAGKVQTLIELDDVEQQACGEWEELCEFSDDDVHYLEFEQPWTGGIKLQRQLMLLRDDRCLLLGDTVMTENGSFEKSRVIHYSSRLPIGRSIKIESEEETREAFFSDGSRRGMIVPLAATEWRIGATDATLKETNDHHVLHSVKGQNRLYAPLWFDFQQRRFKRMRTWRQLTVADQLRIVGRDESVAYRIQIGSEHWMVYRSLGDLACRTALGKHLIADFYCSRFDPGDGSHDEMVTVDDNEPSDD